MPYVLDIGLEARDKFEFVVTNNEKAKKTTWTHCAFELTRMSKKASGRPKDCEILRFFVSKAKNKVTFAVDGNVKELGSLVEDGASKSESKENSDEQAQSCDITIEVAGDGFNFYYNTRLIKTFKYTFNIVDSWLIQFESGTDNGAMVKHAYFNSYSLRMFFLFVFVFDIDVTNTTQ